MKQLKRTIAIVCGGDSSEYEVSLRSAQGLFSFFDEVCRILSKPTYVGGVSTFFHFIITKKSQIPLESDSVKIYYLIPYANKSTLAPAAE